RPLREARERCGELVRRATERAVHDAVAQLRHEREQVLEELLAVVGPRLSELMILDATSSSMLQSPLMAAAQVAGLAAELTREAAAALQPQAQPDGGENAEGDHDDGGTEADGAAAAGQQEGD